MEHSQVAADAMCPWYNEELIAISENDASRCKALYSCAHTDGGGENADPRRRELEQRLAAVRDQMRL